MFFALSRSQRVIGLRGLALAGLVLGLFVVSQIAITMLGEGVRDLSKHLWAAQWALDMLVLLLALQALGWLRYGYQARGGRLGADTVQPKGR